MPPVTTLDEVTNVELSESDIAAFGRDGYLLIESAFSDDELDTFREAADRILELSINATVALGRRHPRLDAKLHDDGTVTVRKIQPINDLDPRLAAIADDERLLGPLRQLMGDEPILMEEKLNPKQLLDTRHVDVSVLASSSFNHEVGLEGFHLQLVLLERTNRMGRGAGSTQGGLDRRAGADAGAADQDFVLARFLLARGVDDHGDLAVFHHAKALISTTRASP